MNEQEEVEEMKGKQEGEEEEGHNPASSEAAWTQHAASFELVYSPQQRGEVPLPWPW